MIKYFVHTAYHIIIIMMYTVIRTNQKEYVKLHLRRRDGRRAQYNNDIIILVYLQYNDIIVYDDLLVLAEKRIMTTTETHADEKKKILSFTYINWWTTL